MHFRLFTLKAVININVEYTKMGFVFITIMTLKHINKDFVIVSQAGIFNSFTLFYFIVTSHNILL